ncbi:YjbH domain-containing protein [Teichococcus vastitatis]|uniref:YjbH domain-containing protein n=1 Tax=Teichococcus vastitatis TaxID=2307076 RepID=A0ABS9VZT9_9PROT|nr:YjbH domain-containing protein [Pseudoroseomonas vastitatis]MCI0752524.1 YjbH domain-containing protein [Pseudoroseomonas vastitatis]
MLAGKAGKCLGLVRVAAMLLLAGLGAARAEEIPATGGDFGGVGLIEMRNARLRPDGTLEAGTAIRHQRRFWFLNFQALPFLETTFRLTERLDATSGRGMTTDRAFDLKLRLLEETDTTPALAIGLQDFIGTGLYAGEYIAASKRWWGFDVTAGLGWGRIGTGAEWNSPLALASDSFRDRPRDVGRGGTVQTGFFRGEDMAPFAGVEWSVPAFGTPWGALDGLRAKAEWSGDALRDERGGYPARRTALRGEAESRVNLGLQWSNGWADAGLHFVHGTDLLFRLSLRMDPAEPPSLALPAPPPLSARPRGIAGDEVTLAQAVFDRLAGAGFRGLAFRQDGGAAEIALSGGSYRTLPQVTARALRAVQPVLPPGLEMLRLRWWRSGTEIAVLDVPRLTLEALAVGLSSPEEAWMASRLLPATGELAPGTLRAPGPFWDWEVGPRLGLALGDPSRTLRWQASLGAGARLDLGSGFALAGGVQQALFGNLSGGLPSDSLLPHVRSDYAEYARQGRTAVSTLYAERIWTLAPDVFARASAGYLEPMFGGLSAEVLWRPQDRPFALGLDLNWVAQREFDGKLGFRGYSVATGHASLYADLPVWNLFGILRAGRYLAGDWGTTVEVGRRFDSGIEVGGFATFTNVSAARFGEGSFDKGLYVRIPLSLFGRQDAGIGSAVIRPVQRDGGQRLSVDNPLWEVTRDGRQDALRRSIGGFAR